MAKAMALLAGLKEVNPAAYGGWNGQGGCWGCELDVDNVERILKPLGYDIQVLKTKQATGEAIINGLKNAAAKLAAGDIFVFYFSGHGGQQPDTSGDERDGKDETLVAYDRQVIDDELNDVWLAIKPGVRVVMLSDSCNSGTNYKLFGRDYYPTPIEPVDASRAKDMQAQLIHFGGCRDSSTSSGYLTGGAFTMALCNAWDNGAFEGSYADFHKKICSLVKTGQKPQHNEYGPVSEEFKSQKPFTTGPARPGSVTFTLEIASGDLARVRKTIEEDAVACLLSALENASTPGGGAATGTCCASSEGDWDCAATATWKF